MNQIALPFAWPAGENERDFIVTDANRLAVRHLEHRSLWPVMACVLIGPRKSGRSLLGRIFAAKAAATLIDNAERHDEEALFHAWNAAQASHVPLLMIAESTPAAWGIRLPDLRSRLLATPTVAIEEPDDELAARLIEKLLIARGLFPAPEVLRYLSPRIERSYLAIHRTVEAMDELSLERRQRITVPVARDVLAGLGTNDLD
ncbi:HdaA/DnaA family protein [Sphingomonas montanisoli]|uniref:Chromosomal replication initiator DnaA n=1 Tax=Sphingomonas montanisoli TaxID=2606412 RepID=A0A5D9BZL9_9SPHN|nr:chromosomal replication initiator DnaA [Sphingomonas montanisoli]TZG25048.1 chromosomal replication initiator DnaA [Sphingomonas montanisoli]